MKRFVFILPVVILLLFTAGCATVDSGIFAALDMQNKVMADLEKNAQGEVAASLTDQRAQWDALVQANIAAKIAAGKEKPEDIAKYAVEEVKKNEESAQAIGEKWQEILKDVGTAQEVNALVKEYLQALNDNAKRAAAYLNQINAAMGGKP